MVNQVKFHKLWLSKEAIQSFILIYLDIIWLRASEVKNFTASKLTYFWGYDESKGWILIKKSSRCFFSNDIFWKNHFFGIGDILKNIFFKQSDLMSYINLEINPEFVLRLKNRHDKICHIFPLLRPSIKWWIEMLKNALDMFIKLQKSIEFQLIYHEIV